MDVGEKKPSFAPVIIVGAGPAGSIASLYLSKWKQPHILLDRSNFPREKVCGESYDGKVSHILNDLNPGWLQELFEAEILHKSWAYSLTNSHNRRLMVRFPKDRTPRLQGSRYQLDHFLVQKATEQAYCHFRPGCGVKEMVQLDMGKRLFLQNGEFLDTSLVILATGAQAKLSEVPEGEGLLFARTYFKGIEMPKEKEVEVFFFRHPLKACLILGPLPKGMVNVEIGATKKEYLSLKEGFDQLLARLLDQNAELKRRFEGAEATQNMKGTFLQLGKRKPLVEDHLLRAGSSAWSVNPITGFGVGHAMTMGREAAKVAFEAQKKKAYTSADLMSYDYKVRYLLRDELRLSKVVSFFHRNVNWLEPIINWLGQRTYLEQKLTDKSFISSFYKPWYYWQKKVR